MLRRWPAPTSPIECILEADQAYMFPVQDYQKRDRVPLGLKAVWICASAGLARAPFKDKVHVFQLDGFAPEHTPITTSSIYVTSHSR
jgi:hypothetical protein